ncbi:magnesium transporter [Tardibacter chloracetimidivorans]|uniref:magnesium transporter n=1 Tax=Tardibacter chloracetimidivorans TaxID=1921510 RepID=UPI0009F98311
MAEQRDDEDLTETVDAAPASSPLADDDMFDPAFVDAIIEGLDEEDAAHVQELVEPLHPANIADLFELLDSDRRRRLAAALGPRLDGDVLAEMNDWVRDDLIDALAPHEVADLATQLDTDDAVAIIEDLEAEEQRAVLRAMPADDRAAIEAALSYPEESAGRLMQRELIAVPEHWTVGQIIDYLRENPELTTDFWEVFVVDPGHRPVGALKLSWILRTPRWVPVADAMQREQTLIPVDMDQEEVALRFQKYALISAAVVDSSGRLVGMITVDDVVHIIQEEAGEDITRLSGAGDGDINRPFLETVKTRQTWLIVNLGTALLASGVVSLFQDTISRLVALAVLMPIVASMGGNAGTQTMAVAVRALATNQLTQSNTIRTITRELRIAIANGFTLGVLIGLGVYIIYREPELSGVIAAAMVINNLIAGLSGILVPLTLDRLKVDPAVSSAVFVTMMTDIMGFFSFLGLATLVGLPG